MSGVVFLRCPVQLKSVGSSTHPLRFVAPLSAGGGGDCGVSYLPKSVSLLCTIVDFQSLPGLLQFTYRNLLREPVSIVLPICCRDSFEAA